MKVYDIFLESRDIFTFYQLKTNWYSISHPQFYYSYNNYMWDDKNKSFQHIEYSNNAPLKIATPSMLVNSNEFNSCLESNLLEVVQKVYSLGLEYVQNYNIIIPQKTIGNNLIEFGMFYNYGEGDQINTYLTKTVNNIIDINFMW